MVRKGKEVPEGEIKCSMGKNEPSRVGIMGSASGFAELLEGLAGRNPTLTFSLLYTVSLLPQKRPCARKAEHSPSKIQFDDRPHPETTNGRRLFHDGHIPECVGDVDQVAAGKYARDKEYGLPEG